MNFADIENFLQSYPGISISVIILIFTITLITIPLVILRLPVNYFTHISGRSSTSLWKHSLIVLAMNIAGILLMLLGIIMLFLPGQGLLTIFCGLMLLSFPGKRRLIQHLITNQKLREYLNWIRRKGNKPPFHFKEN